MEKYALERDMGFDMENFSIPEGVLNVPTPSGRIDHAYLRETAKHFENLLL